MSEYAVVAENISKSYKMYSNSRDKLKDLLLPNDYGKDFFALKGISFKVKKGEVVGLLGLNGSGKSTLSTILGGISVPTTGKIFLDGEPAIIAISSGLNNQLTGLENIELKGLMLGFSKARINEITNDIIDFADIGEFINHPVKTYSSGMKARLGFAISVNINPDILIIDEALSVGDATFTQKCLDKMMEFKNNGKTIFFVSHALQQVREFCTKAMWIEYGTLKAFGDINEIVDQYQGFLNKYNRMSSQEKKKYKQDMIANNNHLLAKDYEQVSSVYKHRLQKYGKLLNYVQLIKNKDIKIVPYNFDLHTLVFSIFIAIYRKDKKSFLSILSIIIVSIFLFDNPFVGYMTLMLLFSIISGRLYAKMLINKMGYEPYDNEEDKEKVSRRIKNKKVKKNKFINILCIIIFTIMFISTAFINPGSCSPKFKLDAIKTDSKSVDESKVFNFVVARENPDNITKYWRNSILSLDYKNNIILNSLYLIKINESNFDVSIQSIPSKLQVDFPDRGYSDELIYAHADCGKDGLIKIIEHNFGFKPDNLLIMNDKDINKLLTLMNIKGSVNKNTLDINVNNNYYKLHDIEKSQLVEQEKMSKMAYNIIINLLKSDKESFSEVKSYIQTLSSEFDIAEFQNLYELYNTAIAENGEDIGRLTTSPISINTVKIKDVLKLDNKKVMNKAKLLEYDIYLYNGDYKGNIFYKLFNK